MRLSSLERVVNLQKHLYIIRYDYQKKKITIKQHYYKRISPSFPPRHTVLDSLARRCRWREDGENCENWCILFTCSSIVRNDFLCTHSNELRIARLLWTSKTVGDKLDSSAPHYNFQRKWLRDLAVQNGAVFVTA